MTDYTPEMMPARIIVRPNGAAPLTVPDDLLPEWEGITIAMEQEYIRADIHAAAIAALEADVAMLRQSLESVTAGQLESAEKAISEYMANMGKPIQQPLPWPAALADQPVTGSPR